MDGEGGVCGEGGHFHAEARVTPGDWVGKRQRASLVVMCLSCLWPEAVGLEEWGVPPRIGHSQRCRSKFAFDSLARLEYVTLCRHANQLANRIPELWTSLMQRCCWTEGHS